MSFSCLTPTTRHSSHSPVPLADLFLIFGIHPESLSTSLHTAIGKQSVNCAKPEILDSYPKEVSNKDYQYIEGLEMICFPEGYKVEKVNEMAIMIRFAMNHFTITGSDGSHKYATALTFVQTVNLHLDPLDDLDPKFHSVPKAFCLVSCIPLFEFHK
eukprot:TRINITY_DN3292_c0_g1_i12.p1 TRINITY_DN3292_c0_g1~~TRINITY_DN3292_c0_g1_i12.p1  ORF type:complete len:157 (+),score=12.28 TRINITY_DN3292_c0_g1_i12:99-569(+)